MKYTKVMGCEGAIPVSKIVLGTSRFGSDLSLEQSYEMMDYYYSCGGNTLDSARVYADWLPGGKSASELTIGKWMKSRNNRSEIVVITKGGHPPLDQFDLMRINATEIRYDLELSLSCLDTDYIDIYFLHRDDESLSVESMIDIMDVFVKEGKIKALGVSNWKASRIKAANEYAKKVGKTPITTSQIQWSYAYATPKMLGDDTLVSMNQEEYQIYQELKIPVMSFSSQAKGFFIYCLKYGMDNLPKKLEKFICEENRIRLEKLKIAMKETGLTPEMLSLGYIMSNEVDGIVLIGASNMEQLKRNLESSDCVIDTRILD